MVVNRIKKNTIFLFCLAIMGLTIFPFMGCGGGGGGGGSAISPTPAPADINVSNTQIVFGDVVLNSFSEESLLIQNTGSSNLIIDQIAHTNPLSTPFSILNDNCSGKQLPPSQTCTLRVRFSPTSQGGFTDVFDIPSNDPAKSSVAVSVSGYGNARGLKVSITQVNEDSCPKVKSLITVTDENANPLPGLLQNNFSLFENSVLKPITNFSEVKSPVSVALVLDYSETMQWAIPDVETASKVFIDLLDSANNDEAAIIKYATEIYLIQPFTTDKVALKAAIDFPFTGSPYQTHLYDALWLAIEETAKRANMRAIVLISDGQEYSSIPGVSDKTLPEVISHAKEKEVTIFTIGLGSVEAGVMNQLANETGGQYFFAPTSPQISSIYQAISKILSGQYLIEYSSSSSGNSSIILDVVVDYDGFQGKASKNIPGCP